MSNIQHSIFKLYELKSIIHTNLINTKKLNKNSTLLFKKIFFGSHLFQDDLLKKKTITKNWACLPASMRFHAYCRLHPAASCLVQIVGSRCSPKGLFFERCDRAPDWVQGRFLNTEHHLVTSVAPKWL